ncbi:MAG: YbaB/EbfC family nucleoid-associated protein, partial [Caldiserica bacterium]|nr:YbaB/EbfC family nucleoid-associated protein [Caldisericota bacterium]
MKQAQKMQEDAARADQELLDRRISVTSGGGAVTAVVNGK